MRLTLRDFLPPPGPVTVWLMGVDAAAVFAAYPAVDDALKKRSGHRLLITLPADELPGLRRRLPHEVVAAQPGPAGTRRWLRTLQPILVVLLGVDGSGEAARTISFTGRTDVSVEKILAALPGAPTAPRSVQRHRLRELGVRLAVGRPLAGLDALGCRLGRPDCILCLGNGPSSEDPALADVGADRLFRVTWPWRGRGRLTEPDVVFTADPELPGRRHRPIICFPRRDLGVAVLVRHLLALRPPSGYLFLDGLPDFADELAADPIPTNGALMIAVAAALAPRELVIAGIDLYAHAAGRYPGDSEALDGYSRQHDRDCDLALIRRALDGFDGRVTIFGETLRAALGRQRA